MRQWRSAVWRRLAIVTGVLGVAGVLCVVLVVAPPWFVPDRSLEGLKAQNEVRTTLLQGVGGLVLLAGAYFTYRQVRTALMKTGAFATADTPPCMPGSPFGPTGRGGRGVFAALTG